MKRRVLKTIIAILLINMLVIKISPIVYAVNGEVLEVSEKKNDSSSEEIDNEDEKEDNTDVEKREDNTDVEEIEDENDVEAIDDKKNVEEIDNIYQEYIETQNIIYKNEDEIKIREKNEQEINEEDVNDEAEIIEKTEKLEEKKLLNSNIISQVEVKKDEDEEVIDDTGNLGIAYKGFINNQGNSKWKLNDSLLGTENQGIDLNGLKIELTNEPTGAGIEYQVLEETTNGSKQWSSWKTNGELAGFEENNKKIYAIKIRLINMPNYSVEYRVHRRYQGWESQYVSDGEIAGTEYTDSRLEGIKIRIVPKISKSIGIKYKGYINNNGYQEYSKDDMLTGTENQGIDLNGLKIELTNAPTGTGIEYQVLEETTNGSKQWSSWKTNGELAGFEENNKKIYAIKIRLINMPNYSVEYRVHRRYQGWESQYVSDEEIAGTEYTDSRLEGIKIRIVPKISKSIGIKYKGYINNNGYQEYSKDDMLTGTENQGIDLNGLKIELTNVPTGAGIEYQVLEETTNGGKQWSSWKTNGELAGFEENNKKIYAIKIRLINMPNYSVEYRVHRRYQGWESQYVSDGEIAGTEYTDSRLEGIKIRIVPKIRKSIGVQYKGYVDNQGYQEWTNNGMLAGTENKGTGLNGLKIELTNAPSEVGIEYQVLKDGEHGKEWTSWLKNGEIAGFSQNERNIYAIKIRLSNTNSYSVKYRVHRQYQGWEYSWKWDGLMAGLENGSSRLEGIQITIVPKIQVITGIDISQYQNIINWSEVRNSGINFSIIRVGYRGYGSGKIVYDPYFMMNIKGALLNGIDCGVYFYTQAINESEAIEEANWVINAVKPYNIVYPIVIDTEWSSENKNGRADWISTEQRTKYIQAFCRTIKEAGYNPMIYANKDWLENHLNMDELSEYSVWLAHYVTGAPDNKSDYQRPYVMWQYTSSGNVNGIEGNVDMDLYYY